MNPHSIFLPALIFMTCCYQQSHAYTVTKLYALYQDGQVFLAWKNPPVTNLRYNVYRSKTKFISPDQFTTFNYLGSVRDSSSKNLRRCRIEQKDIFFKCEDGDEPLASDKGLYVVTCMEPGWFFYAVTVTDLKTGIEDKTLLPAKNTVDAGIQEFVADPQPVRQDSLIWNNGDVAQMYAQFGNNQFADHYRAMNNQGSYGYNFYVIRRGATEKYPLFIFYEGIRPNSLTGNGLDAFSNLTGCYIMGVDDWIPYPDGYATDAGKTTSWVGYHEDFDMYAVNNPVPKEGIIKTYTQQRLVQTILWARKYLPNVDSTRVYLVGVSAGGYGVLLTANMIPEKIAAVYTVVEPVQLESDDGWRQALWGTRADNLICDVPDPLTKTDLPIFDFMNIKCMIGKNKNRNLPPIYSVHGKKDQIIGWKDKPGFFDTVLYSYQGGVMFWDQREHDGTNSTFLDSETMPDFYSFQTNKSYLAFSNCSVDQDPGNGKRIDGDDFGAINGYLKYDVLRDEKCLYSARIFVRDFYAGGMLHDEQYESAEADVTVRRQQQFKLFPGTDIFWEVTDTVGTVLKADVLTFNGGPITIPGVEITRNGVDLTLHSGLCTRNATTESIENNVSPVRYIRSGDGWFGQVTVAADQEVCFTLYTVTGCLIESRKIQLVAGSNMFPVAIPQPGLFVASISGAQLSDTAPLVY